MEWDIDNLPNRLTIFRLVLVPLVVIALMFNLEFFEISQELKSTLGWTAAWIFVAPSITDFLMVISPEKGKSLLSLEVF